MHIYICIYTHIYVYVCICIYMYMCDCLYVHVTKFYKSFPHSLTEGDLPGSCIFCYYKQSSNKHSNFLEYVFFHAGAF